MPLRRAVSALLLGLAAPTMAAPLPIERIFAAPDLSGQIARGVDLSPDGRLVTFLQPKSSDQRVLDLWAAPTDGDGPARLLVDSASLGADRPISEAEASRRERQRMSDRGIVEYRWDSAGKQVLVPVAGELFVADAASGAVRKAVPLGPDGADATDARFSPRGGFISFIRQGSLMLVPAAGGEPRAVSPNAAGAVSYGVAEFIAQEEMARDTGTWWRPDDGAIAYTRVDESKVQVVERLEIGTDGNRTVTQRYPFAGSPNAVVDLFVQPLTGGPAVKVDLGPNPDVYLARVHWSADGRTLYAQRQSRDQTRLDLLAIDPGTGASRVILSEVQKPWVELNLDFTPLRDGSFLWLSERGGTRELYLHAADGTLIRQVTSGDRPLAGVDRQPSLIGVDQQRGIAYVLASTPDRIERHLYAVDYVRGGPMQRITSGEGWWTPRMNATATAFVGTFANPRTPPQTALYGADGQRRRWLTENRLEPGHPYYPYLEGLPVPEFGQIAAEDGQKMDYVLLKPAGFDPAKRYPAIVQIYGGPGRQHVYKGWRNPTERIYIDNGFVVFQLDNRGTTNGTAAFESVIAGQLGTSEVRDQIRGLRFLQSLPFVDPKRVGITGWSYGGFMTLRLLTEPGSGFASGAAGAAPGEWQLYDTHYTERFLGLPQDNPEAYRKAAILPRLEALNGRLLLMHGMADDNVLFENATAIMAKLQQQGRTFDLMLYPGQRHGIADPALKLQQWRTYLEFFQRTLGGPEPK